MTEHLFNRLDAAAASAQACRAYLGQHDGIEKSWHNDEYQARPEIARWYNCREQGYVISMRGPNYKGQINIAFFEHRNSDALCAVLWEEITVNPPTIDTAKFGSVYKDKGDVSHSVSYNQPYEMATWIYEQLETFWVNQTP